MIELVGVNKWFGERQVLADISLTVPAGQTTAIIGPSGAGKSLLLKHMVGLIRPDAGQVLCMGTDLGCADRPSLYAVRRRMGMLFQDGALFDSMSVGDNVGFPLAQHASELEPEQRRARVDALLSLVGLPGTYDRAVPSLSGGQRKRVGLARAIALEPEVVLFDEPNSGLDPITSDAIDELIVDMKERLGITFVVISHDIIGTFRVADRIACLFDGRIVAQGTTHDILRSSDPRVRQFLQRNLVLPVGTEEVAQPPRLG